MSNSFFIFSLLSLCLIFSKTLLAGGPLIIEGLNGDTPVTYQNPNITLHVESGTLGSRSNAEANALLREAFALWNDINTSTVNLIVDPTINATPTINVDINISNYDSFIPSADGSNLNERDGLNPVVYDNNGEIIDLLLGSNQSDSTIGLAASIFTERGDYFLEGYVILNGKDLGQSDTEIKLLISHEIGHFFGLDHSQLDINNQETDLGFPGFCTTTMPGRYPVMYPFICRNTVSLHADDIGAASALYPVTNIKNSFGILQGHFVDEAGIAILGANLWLENTLTGETYSIVSDYLRQCTGFYQVYLPAGSYTLHANSINTIFTAGSGVGPYTFDAFDASFIDPHPIAAVTYQGEVDITVGQTTDINFDINGNQVSADFIKDSLWCLSNSISSDDNGGGGANAPLTLLLLLSILITGRRLTNLRLRK